MTKSFSNYVVLSKKTFPFPFIPSKLIVVFFQNTFIQGRQPYLYKKCNFFKHFLPARETILRLLVEVNFVSWVSVSLEMMDSSLKPIMRSPGSGSKEPGISFRLKFSELFMLNSNLLWNGKGQSFIVKYSITTSQHHPIHSFCVTCTSAYCIY